MRSARRLGILTTGSLATLVLSAAGASASDASSSMAQITNLFWIVAILALLIGLFVGVVMVVTILKFRIRKGHNQPLPNLKTSNHRIEAAWTITPAVILLVVGMLAFGTLAFTDTIPQHVDVYVSAIGHQWYWEFWTNYTNGTHVHSVGGFTVRSNLTIQLNVTSVDVDHSLFIPAMGVHIDAIPGHENQIWFKPVQPGSYDIECTQFCGLNHYAMVGTLTVAS